MTIAARVVIFPIHYVQGPGIFRYYWQLLRQFGKKCLVVGGKTALTHTKDALLVALDKGAVNATWELFSGDPTEEEVKRLVEVAKQENVEFIVGVGGGRVLDTAKAVALFTGTSIVTVPTVASTESATSTISVLYDQEGHFSRYVSLPRNPELILVDSQILADAPSRFLAAGFASALATSYAVDAISASGKSPPYFVRCIAKSSREFCLENARDALKDAQAHNLTPLLEDAFEIPLLFSTISFELGGGLAAAHAFYHGVRSVWPKICHQSLCSEIVSFGTTVQLLLEQRPKREIEHIIALNADIGMPVTLEDLFLPADKKELRTLANVCAQDNSMANMPFVVSGEMVLQAILAADRAGQRMITRSNSTMNASTLG